MSGTDFFDDDLIRQRDVSRRGRSGTGDDPSGLGSHEGSELPARPVSDLNLTRMARHRKEVDTHAAIAAQELERLRKRQEQLEQEKRELEELRRRQDEYERGKREMTETLKRSLVALERKEIDAQRTVELLADARVRFKELLAEVEQLKEEVWPEDRIREELAKSLGILEQARLEYSKTMAKIEAVKPEAAAASGKPTVILEDRSGDAEDEKSFLYWLKVGLAFTLPLTAAILLVGLLFLFARISGYY
ncbi:MAG: hypothetical protein NZ740_05780 [Kiritimatiellae bacterium]|nr:hypothetical protein [Kiritimatiellia bacterium]MDW8458602.1 hypothetical protein [Verrucomicrobiota bacterium]